MYQRSLVSYNLCIREYARIGHTHQALQLFHQIMHEGVIPDKVTFLSILPALDSNTALPHARLMHARIVANGLASDVVVGTALLNLYGKFGRLQDAGSIFDEISERDVVSWNALIKACTQHGQCGQALGLFDKMQQEEGLVPNTVTFVGLLDACVRQATLADGQRMHTSILEIGLDPDVVLGTALVNMYGRCGDQESARHIFDQMPIRNVVTWNSMIAVYGQQGQGEEALELFEQMYWEGIIPSNVTFVSILGAFTNHRALAEGQKMHARIVDSGLESNIVIQAALFNMYVKCGGLQSGQMVFDSLLKQDVVSWTCMITMYAQHQKANEAFQIFYQMQVEGLMPDKVTFVSIVGACASKFEGRRIHAWILARGFESDVVLGTALLSLYGKCGSLEDAWKIFNKMSKRDVVSWTVIIGLNADAGQCKMCLQLFEQMHEDGVTPDKVTFISILDLCVSCAGLAEGERMHVCILQSGLEEDTVLGTALVNMYGKCSSLNNARRVFERMPKRDVISWNAMITVYGQHGQCQQAVQLFKQMQLEDIVPDTVTFVNILTACSHSGLIDEGCQLFAFMNRESGILPNMDHYACFIDLLGRAGRLDEAEQLINNMPFEATDVPLTTLLGACRYQQDLERAKQVAGRLLEIDPQNATSWILLSSIYVAAERQDDATM